MSQYQSGLEGERLAAEYLNSLGIKIIQTRVRSRHGEVDIVAQDGNALLFIEVKYRPDGRLGSGVESVTPEKRSRLKGAVLEYLAGSPRAYRIGIVEITRAGVWYIPDILQEC